MNLVVHLIDIVTQAVTVRVGRRGRRVMRIRAAGLLVDAEPAVTVEVHVQPNTTETVDADQPGAVAGVANRRVQDAGDDQCRSTSSTPCGHKVVVGGTVPAAPTPVNMRPLLEL